MMLTHEQRAKLATEAVAKRRAELINQPVMRIYPQLVDAAVTAYLAGDVVMPKEPTWQMEVAARDADWPYRNTYGELGDLDKDTAANSIYRAMISAK
jgi:hypothetical protein